MTTEVPAAALRLRDRLLKDGTRILDLDPQHEGVQAVECKPCSLIIRTDLPGAPDIPLLDIEISPWRPAIDRMEIRDMANRAFACLATIRAWRRAGTAALPVRLLRTDRFTLAVLAEAGIGHQAFADLTWRSGELLPFGMRSVPWNDARQKPSAIRFRSSRAPDPIQFPAGTPWLAGFSTFVSLVATAVRFDDGLTVGHTSGPDGRAIVTVPRGNDLAVVATTGGNLQHLLRNDVLKRFYLPVADYDVLRRSVRYTVDWRDAGADASFDDDADAMRLVKEEITRLDTTGGPVDPRQLDLLLSIGLGN